MRKIFKLGELKASLETKIGAINIEIASDFLSKALLSLDTLYGKSDVEDRLEVVFNKFCIGK